MAQVETRHGLPPHRRLREMFRGFPFAPPTRRIAAAWCFLVVFCPNVLVAFLDPFASPALRGLRLFFAFGLVLLPWTLVRPFRLLWLVLPVSVLAQLEVLHVLLLGGPTSIGMIHSLLETTPQEVSETIQQVWPALLSLCVLPVGTAASLAVLRAHPPKPRSRASGLAVTALAVAGVASEPAHLLWYYRHSLHPVVLQDALTQQIQRTFPFGTLWKASDAVGNRIAQFHRRDLAARFRWDPSSSTAAGIRETYVVVIGESSRSGNWSLYGYPKPTNPRLAKVSDLVVFSDATSSANITLQSVPLILTLATPREPGIFDTTSSVLSCFRQAGFKTWWLSTQGRFTVWDGKPAMIGEEADSTLFLSSERAGRKSLDVSLLPELDAALADTATKKLIVLHTNGSHFPYEARYTEEFQVFQPDATTSDTLARYDNSILATDAFLDLVVGRLGRRSEVSALAFLSDHGEALGEKGKYFHCGLAPVRAEFEIPYLVWVSPQLGRLRPTVHAALLANRDRPTSQADFVPTLLGMAGLRTRRADSSRSLASVSYRPRPRLAITPAYALLDVDTLEGTSLRTRTTVDR